MNNVDVNYLAVLVAGVVNMVVGFLWFGPVFGKKWIELMKFTPEQLAEGRQKSMAKSYVIMFAAALIMAYVLYHSLAFASGFMQQSGWMIGAQGGFWMWLGFIMPVTLSRVLWEGRSWGLWFFDNGYYLVTLLLNGAIIGAWM